MARSIAASAPRRIARGRTLGGLQPPAWMAGAAGAVRTAAGYAWRRRRLRMVLIAVLASVPLLGGGWWLARHSSLTAVEHVQITGLAAVRGTSAGAPATAAIEAALGQTARHMSTLAVDTAALRRAIARYPIVRSIRAHPSFPHGLRIEVIERPPAASLSVGGVRTAVAADGVVLGPGYLTSSLPFVDIPSGALPAAGRRVHAAALLQAIGILGAARAPLRRAVVRIYMGPQGLTVALRNGLLAYFGDGTRPHAKWIALTSVLADPSSAGAAYIDVRVPERPAAGFAPGALSPAASAGEAESPGVADQTTAAELAAGLDATVGGGESAAPGSTEGGEAGASEAAPGETSAAESLSTVQTEPESTSATGSEATG
jgi:cell division protein FtsQ